MAINHEETVSEPLEPIFWQLRILLASGEVEMFDLAGPGEIERDWKNSLPEGYLCIRFRGCRAPGEWVAARFNHWGDSDRVIVPTPNQPGSVKGGWRWDGEWEAQIVDDPVLAGCLR